MVGTKLGLRKLFSAYTGLNSILSVHAYSVHAACIVPFNKNDSYNFHYRCNFTSKAYIQPITELNCLEL